MSQGNKEDSSWRSRSGRGEGIISGRRDQISEGKLDPGFLGECTCPLCRTTVRHRLGIPCFRQRCPKCGAPMMRK